MDGKTVRSGMRRQMDRHLLDLVDLVVESRPSVDAAGFKFSLTYVSFSFRGIQPSGDLPGMWQARIESETSSSGCTSKASTYVQARALPYFKVLPQHEPSLALQLALSPSKKGAYDREPLARLYPTSLERLETFDRRTVTARGYHFEFRCAGLMS